MAPIALYRDPPGPKKSSRGSKSSISMNLAPSRGGRETHGLQVAGFCLPNEITRNLTEPRAS